MKDEYIYLKLGLALIVGIGMIIALFAVPETGKQQINEVSELVEIPYFIASFTNRTSHGCRYNLYIHDGAKAVRVGYVYYPCRLDADTIYKLHVKDYLSP